jgi:methionyl-tRNA formyltransferase
MTISIVFMGTPDFAVPPLQALHRAGYSIPLVISQPDRPQGRGRKLVHPPVKKAALDLGLTVVQPQRINGSDIIPMIEAVKPDFFVVVAFGQIISEKILGIPRLAPINIHASLLPAYRGAAPIQRSIICGEEVTGITTMLMDKGMDTGDMLLSESVKILDDDTSETLSFRLSRLGADLILRTIDGFVNGRIKPVPQDHTLATYAPMLSKNEGLLDWSRPSKELDWAIRGMTPWPGAYTYLGDKRFRIIKAVPLDVSGDGFPGTVLESKPDILIVKTGTGALSIHEIQGDSGKRLSIADFLRGFTINKGDHFS